MSQGYGTSKKVVSDQLVALGAKLEKYDEEKGLYHLRIRDDSPDYLVRLGMIETYQRNDHHKGCDMYNLALEIDWEHQRAYIERGKYYRDFRRGREYMGQAVEDFNKAIMYDENDKLTALAYYHRARVPDIYKPPYVLAVNDYSKALELGLGDISDDTDYSVSESEILIRRGLASLHQALDTGSWDDYTNAKIDHTNAERLFNLTLHEVGTDVLIKRVKMRDELGEQLCSFYPYIKMVATERHEFFE